MFGKKKELGKFCLVLFIIIFLLMFLLIVGGIVFWVVGVNVLKLIQEVVVKMLVLKELVFEIENKKDIVLNKDSSNMVVLEKIIKD